VVVETIHGETRNTEWERSDVTRSSSSSHQRYGRHYVGLFWPVDVNISHDIFISMNQGPRTDQRRGKRFLSRGSQMRLFFSRICMSIDKINVFRHKTLFS
jgi:hypothetical protein